MESLSKDKLAKVNRRIYEGVNLLVVSKKRSQAEIKSLYDLGQRDFGENKVQELIDKSLKLADTKIRWHFIGHLQSNKVTQLLNVKSLVAIHSIDSMKILNKILSRPTSQPIGLFLQINTSLEAEKSGFESFDAIKQAVSAILSQENYFLQGLMTIGKVRTDDFEIDACVCFEKMKNYKEILDKEFGVSLELSMGMSNDFELAQKYGANWVRIGSLLF